MSIRWRKKAATALMLVAGAYVTYLAFVGGLYFYADHKYESCVSHAEQPLTRDGIEDCLGPHTISECRGTYQTGSRVEASGDCIRYHLLGVEAIDVTYAWGEVVRVRPTYE